MAKTVGKYEINRLLGEGQFGKVKEAVDLETGIRLAVKMIKKSAIKTKKDVETVKKEVAFMKTLNGHENILNMYDVIEDKEKLYLVLELAAGGDLFDKIIAHGGFSEETARLYFKQILSGLTFCHSKGIIHRDMKPENLLLGDNDILKISDFGLSNVIMTPNQMLQTHCGSEKYAAPEVMQTTDPYVGPPVDVWSTGVILYIMVGGAFPFVEATMNCELYSALVAGKFEFPKNFSPDLQDLLLRMFTVNPAERITLDEVVKHKWVVGEEAPPVFDGGIDDISSFPMEEEPVYRTLDPDIMSVDAVGFEEEPVYRSVDVDSETMSASPVMKSATVGDNMCNFAKKPTCTFSSTQSPSQLLAKLKTLFEGHGATVKIKEEKGQLKAECKTPSGNDMKIKVLVQSNEAGRSQVGIMRVKGPSLEYCNMFQTLRPLMDDLCSCNA